MAVSTTGSVTESQDTEGMRPTQPAPVIYLLLQKMYLNFVYIIIIIYIYIFFFTQANVLNFNKQVLVFHPEILLYKVVHLVQVVLRVDSTICWITQYFVFIFLNKKLSYPIDWVARGKHQDSRENKTN